MVYTNSLTVFHNFLGPKIDCFQTMQDSTLKNQCQGLCRTAG